MDPLGPENMDKVAAFNPRDAVLPQDTCVHLRSSISKLGQHVRSSPGFVGSDVLWKSRELSTQRLMGNSQSPYKPDVVILPIPKISEGEEAEPEFESRSLCRVCASKHLLSFIL